MSDRTHPDSGPVTPGEAGFTAADMATAAAQGFRDGVASLSLPAAGQEPVARTAAGRDELFQAAIDFIRTLTGMEPPPIEVAPPEVFAPFREFVDKVQAITARFAAPQPAVAAGWVMVPIEPTLEMITDATRAYQQAVQSLGVFNAPWAAYRAMLAALPPAPSTEGESNG